MIPYAANPTTAAAMTGAAPMAMPPKAPAKPIFPTTAASPHPSAAPPTA
ncbi:hypothetical protein [Nostoc sp.]